jgi:hypothetical protein
MELINADALLHMCFFFHLLFLPGWMTEVSWLPFAFKKKKAYTCVLCVVLCSVVLLFSFSMPLFFFTRMVFACVCVALVVVESRTDFCCVDDVSRQGSDLASLMVPL